jgi:hypothetical protein
LPYHFTGRVGTHRLNDGLIAGSRAARSDGVTHDARLARSIYFDFDERLIS